MSLAIGAATSPCHLASRRSFPAVGEPESAMPSSRGDWSGSSGAVSADVEQETGDRLAVHLNGHRTGSAASTTDGSPWTTSNAPGACSPPPRPTATPAGSWSWPSTTNGRASSPTNSATAPPPSSNHARSTTPSRRSTTAHRRTPQRPRRHPRPHRLLRRHRHRARVLPGRVATRRAGCGPREIGSGGVLRPAATHPPQRDRSPPARSRPRGSQQCDRHRPPDRRARRAGRRLKRFSALEPAVSAADGDRHRHRWNPERVLSHSLEAAVDRGR